MAADSKDINGELESNTAIESTETAAADSAAAEVSTATAVADKKPAATTVSVGKLSAQDLIRA
ncbi:MAG: 50S ribosomal protein L19, partial [Vulcanococcus sp.]